MTPGCKNPVGAGLYWLCDKCYKQAGDGSIGGEHNKGVVNDLLSGSIAINTIDINPQYDILDTDVGVS